MEQDERPWGGYEVLLDEPGYKVKRITLKAGQRFSLQRHHLRGEHWFFVQGEGIATVLDCELPVQAGQALTVPREAAHRLYNSSSDPLVFIEIQRGEYLGEDDIERLEDDYGRISK